VGRSRNDVGRSRNDVGRSRNDGEKGRSSLGTPISALAHKRVMKKTVTRIHRGIMPRGTLPPSSLHTPPVTSTPASFLHTPPVTSTSPASFLHTPPVTSTPGVIPGHAARYVHPGVIPAHAARYVHPGVIPAKAGILTRISFYKGPAVVVNCAGIPSRHLSYAKCDELYILKSLVWIRAICKPKRP